MHGGAVRRRRLTPATAPPPPPLPAQQEIGKARRKEVGLVRRSEYIKTRAAKARAEEEEEKGVEMVEESGGVSANKNNKGNGADDENFPEKVKKVVEFVGFLWWLVALLGVIIGYMLVSLLDEVIEFTGLMLISLFIGCT